ncbi:MAG: hypothetical protein KGL39_57115 [Patescibacteria group bacterium]|nr:hypothetical protein [Patescibacteria group bacterium]
MSTKRAAKARVMWADKKYPLPDNGDWGFSAHRIEKDDKPVLVLPLDPASLAAARERVRHAINWWWEGESDFATCLERSTEDALKALHPALGKGGK